MVKFYVDRIRAGKMILDQVPARWKNAVKKALKDAEAGEEE